MRKIMRFLALLLAVFLSMPVLFAYADAIFEPQNSFYEQHRSQIVYLGRRFVARSEDGNATVWRSPDMEYQSGIIRNGEHALVEYTCLYNGEYWGLTSGFSGWVRMDQMLVEYDFISFSEEHSDEFYNYTGDFGRIKETRSAVAWPWPGADAPISTFDNLELDNLSISHVYLDAYGREWGFVSYLYRSSDVWFCLSEPLNSAIPAFNPAPEPGVWEPSIEHTNITGLQVVRTDEFPIHIVIIVLAVILVAGTAVLIKVLWKPKNSTRG